MVELTINEQIMDDARTIVLWQVDNYELLIERLAIAYKKYRLAFGYPRDYFDDTPNHIKTLWNTNTPKVFQILVDNMGWEYLLKLDKEVFDTRRAEEGLYGADLNIYQQFLYGNFAKCFKMTDEANTFDFRFGFRAKLPINIKKIAYAATESWKKFMGHVTVPSINTRQLMNSYDANCRWPIATNRFTVDMIPISIMPNNSDLSWFTMNNYAHYMAATNTNPMALFYDAVIETYLKQEIRLRPHLVHGYSNDDVARFSLLPALELKNEGLPRLFNLMTFAPVF